jgi:RluA family pseudouridine synthase
MGSPADIPVLWCDAALLVVNKPAGLSTLPDGYDPTMPHIKSILEQEYGRLWIVHRLDKGTSGVLLLARTAQAHRSMNTQFEQHLVLKRYHAIVMGYPEWQELTIDLPLRPNGDRHHRTVIDRQAGKPAVTHLKVLERLGRYSLLEAIPETGRTHQIRAHLSALELFIVGDKLYARVINTGSPGRQTPSDHDMEITHALAKRMRLHAGYLEINHPITGQRIKIEAPYPAEWAEVLEQLRRPGRLVASFTQIVLKGKISLNILDEDGKSLLFKS